MKCLAQKTDETAKDWKIVAKYKIEMLLPTVNKLLSFHPGWSNFSETGLYDFSIAKGEKSRSANTNITSYGTKKTW